MLKDKDIKVEKDCTHLVPPRDSYSVEEYERIVQEAASISIKTAADTLQKIELHCFQMDIDIARYAGNAFLDDDEGQMEFFKGFHRALSILREYIEEKRRPLILKEYENEEKKTYSTYVKEQMATLLPHDHHLFDELVKGLVKEGWKHRGGSPTYALLDKQGAGIKLFRHAESPQVIKICFSAEPEEEEVERPLEERMSCVCVSSSKYFLDMRGYFDSIADIDEYRKRIPAANGEVYTLSGHLVNEDLKRAEESKVDEPEMDKAKDV